MSSLTLSMIVKNEEKYLEGCLESVKGIADEIILVDTGSTDNTIEIARKFGAKVFHFNWINDFSAARNFALRKSSGRWILYLDADERLTEESIEETKKIISKDEKAAYYCLVKSVDEKNRLPHYMRYPRLFYNNKKLEFRSKIHEQIIPSLLELKYEFKQSNIEILHLGYNIEMAGIKEKAQRNLELLLEEYKENPSAYNAFQIGQSYAMLGDKEKAYEYFNKTVETKDKTPKSYKADAYRHMASYCNLKNDLMIAKKYIDNALSIDGAQSLTLITAVKIYQRLGLKKEAAKFCVEAYLRNEESLNGKGNKLFEFIIDSNKLVLFGLEAAVIAEEKETYNFFYNALMDGGKIVEPGAYIKLFKRIINNEDIKENEFIELASCVKLHNMSLILAVLEKYTRNDSKLRLLENFDETLTKQPDFLNSYGLILFELGEYEKSAENINKAIEEGYDNPSAIFTLISIYVLLNRLNDISELIDKVEKLYNGFPEVMDRLKIVKIKILSLQ